MKKLCNVISIICVLWFSYCSIIDYSKAFISDMHSSTVPISISEPVALTLNEAVEIIKEVSNATEASVFCEYTSFINVARTRYAIYASDRALDKTVLYPGSGKAVSFSDNESVSNFSIDENTLSLRYTDLLCDIEVYHMSALCPDKESGYATTYYVESEDYERFTSCLINRGFGITLITDSAASSYTSKRWDAFQYYCLFSIAVCTLFQCFRRSKSIVIKKINGYRLIDVILTEFGQSINISIATTIVAIVLGCAIFVFRNSCGLDFFLFSITGYSVLLGSMLLCIIVPGCYSVFERSASDIKRMRFPKLMQIVSAVIKVIACALVLSNASNTISCGKTMMNLMEARDSIQTVSNSYSLQFNTASVSIDLNMNEVERSCEDLYHILEDDEAISCIFVDSNNYIDDDDDTSNYIYVNEEYFDNLVVWETNFQKITAETIDGVTVFVPEDLYGEYKNECIKFLSQIFEATKITMKPYMTGQLLPTFSPNSGLSRRGYAYSPILVVADPTQYSGAMLSAFSSSYILIGLEDESNTSVIWKAIHEAGLGMFITNIQTVDDMYEEALQACFVGFVERCISTCVYILVYIYSMAFHLTVYFSINSKRIAIKKIAGYGNMSIHIMEFSGKAILFICLFLSSGFMFVDYRVLLSLLVYDILQFYFTELKFCEHNIANTIKGDNLFL